MPHTMAVSSDANDVYVGEIGPNRIWKFVDPGMTTTLIFTKKSMKY